MYFNWAGRLLVLLSPLTVFANNQLSKINTPEIGKSEVHLKSFSLLPNKCITLEAGRTCYAELTVKWQMPEIGDYCLVKRSDNVTIQCWQGVKAGQAMVQFSQPDSEYYDLIEKSGNQIRASGGIKVNRVYKTKRKKKRWRMF